MKIGFVNGSPKPAGSASELFLQILSGKRYGEQYAVRLHGNGYSEDVAALVGCEVLAIAFPLYVDGIPAHFLYWLEAAERTIASLCPGARVYVVVHCGFYEARQTAHALAMMRRWCERAGLVWGRGLGIGGGVMVRMDLEGKGPAKTIGRALEVLAADIAAAASGEELYAAPNFPRALYVWAGNMGWKREIKKNGLRKKDLYRRPAPYVPKA